MSVLARACNNMTRQELITLSLMQNRDECDREVFIIKRNINAAVVKFIKNKSVSQALCDNIFDYFKYKATFERVVYGNPQITTSTTGQIHSTIIELLRKTA